MKIVFIKNVLTVMMIWFSGQAMAALPVSVDGQPLPSLAPILKEVTPSVVNVYTQTRVRVRSPLLNDPIFRRFFNAPETSRERISQSLGSGVIVDAENGYILTNNHVIAQADEIAVGLKDGRSLKATLIGTDPDTDLAVIQIPADEITALPLVDSDDLQVGDFVVAVGNPFGLGQTVTSGIVSALGRTGLRGLEFQNFIQTDASINPGNSGGALINLRGELVGINSAIFTPSGGNVGIGFAIPASMASYVMNQLIQFGEVRRGTLGLFVQDLTAELAGAFAMDASKGALVAEVSTASAAEKSGLQPGDVIVEMSGHKINNAQDFYYAEGGLTLGESLKLEYFREGKRKIAKLVVQTVFTVDGGEFNQRLAGAKFTELSVRYKQQGVSGVLLEDLDPQSRLAKEGLAEDDIITGINRQRVHSLADFQTILDRSRGGLLMQINRQGRAYIVRVD